MKHDNHIWSKKQFPEKNALERQNAISHYSDCFSYHCFYYQCPSSVTQGICFIHWTTTREFGLGYSLAVRSPFMPICANSITYIHGGSGKRENNINIKGNLLFHSETIELSSEYKKCVPAVDSHVWICDHLKLLWF